MRFGVGWQYLDRRPSPEATLQVAAPVEALAHGVEDVGEGLRARVAAAAQAHLLAPPVLEGEAHQRRGRPEVAGVHLAPLQLPRAHAPGLRHLAVPMHRMAHDGHSFRYRYWERQAGRLVYRMAQDWFSLSLRFRNGEGGAERLVNQMVLDWFSFGYRYGEGRAERLAHWVAYEGFSFGFSFRFWFRFRCVEGQAGRPDA